MATITFQPISFDGCDYFARLFAIQSQGTARIGQAFGPVMFVWFVAMALMGIWELRNIQQ